jgi:alkyl sulfatase BDS1-like metallo-beta-lactamase superfamily hydrolase
MKIIAAFSLSLTLATTAFAQESKPATEATRAANAAVLTQLPFEDQTAFELAHRGFVAPISQDAVEGAAGNIVWDPQRYAFIEEGSVAPDTVNPSLWRQAQLLNISGLFKVVDGVYQVRNQDGANLTVIEGEEGITIVDPLLSTETARAALDLYHEHRGDRPLIAVILTHTHVDHYGGIRGVVSQADVDSGKTRIYAPEGFLDHAVSEGVLAGNVMSRRSSYHIGSLLQPSPRGNVAAGMASTLSAGTISLMVPTDEITETIQTVTIDGLDYEFLLAPETEAPAEMVFYLKDRKLLDAAEIATHSLHNTYSPRGARTRDPLRWSKSLNQIIQLWGDEAEAMVVEHMWPLWGNAAINEHLGAQRDMYRYINDETLRLANHGYKPRAIAELIELPEALATKFSNRGYYGTTNHNVKATYDLYLGWYNGNPATLHELPEVEAAKRYVDMMGGVDAVVSKASAYFDEGEYRWVAEVVNHAVMADPDNRTARNLQADALEQLGYQAEAGIWRNYYLSGAKELRIGVKVLPTFKTASPDTIRSMSLVQFFDFLSVRLNGPQAAGKHITLNFEFTDLDEQYTLEMVNGVINHTAGTMADDADATITMTREAFNNITLGQLTRDEAIEAGDAAIEGDPAKLDELLSYLDNFEFWFNIVEPL